LSAEQFDQAALFYRQGWSMELAGSSESPSTWSISSPGSPHDWHLALSRVQIAWRVDRDRMRASRWYPPARRNATRVLSDCRTSGFSIRPSRKTLRQYRTVSAVCMHSSEQLLAYETGLVRPGKPD